MYINALSCPSSELELGAFGHLVEAYPLSSVMPCLREGQSWRAET